jgi:flagellar biosynthesis/type III secretory pathway M-ring protein FliF/YscJ
MKDTLQQIKDTIQSSSHNGMSELATKESESFNWWMIIAVVELLLILFLLLRLKKVHRENSLQNDGFDELRKAKSQDIDMTNLMNSINSSRDLYKELSKKCHPDRFQDETLKNKAENLFQDISKNKRNYGRLLELKEKAMKELDVKF